MKAYLASIFNDLHQINYHLLSTVQFKINDYDHKYFNNENKNEGEISIIKSRETTVQRLSMYMEVS